MSSAGSGQKSVITAILPSSANILRVIRLPLTNVPPWLPTSMSSKRPAGWALPFV
jgi:hypothetical protein